MVNYFASLSNSRLNEISDLHVTLLLSGWHLLFSGFGRAHRGSTDRLILLQYASVNVAVESVYLVLVEQILQFIFG